MTAGHELGIGVEVLGEIDGNEGNFDGEAAR
jgi:hypothetical protein